MHFLISLSTLAGFVLSSGFLGYLGGVYTGVSIMSPRKPKATA